MIVAALGGGILTGNRPASPLASASPAPQASAQPVVMGSLSIGTYAPREFEPPFTFQVTDAGWAAHRDTPGLLGLLREAPPLGSLYVARVDEVIANPCIQGGEGATGPAKLDVIAELRALGHLEVAQPEATTVGRLPATQVDVTVADAALAACGGLVGATDVAVLLAGDEVWSASPGERFRLISVTVGGEDVTILLSLDWSQPHSVPQLENLFQLGSHIVESIDFGQQP